MEGNYIYAPDNRMRNSSEFRCRVPMQGTLQQFLVDGSLSGTPGGFVRNDGGMMVYSVDSGKNVSEVLQLISVRDKVGDIAHAYAVEVGRSSSADILMCFHTMSMDHFETKEKISVRIEENASLNMVLMQNESNMARHRTEFDIVLGRNSRFSMTLVSLHGGDIDNSILVNLDGEGAECYLGGLYLMDREQKISNGIRLNHNVPHCTSNQVFKGILDDSAVAKFNGLVYVAKDAQKTEAMQSNHNILISDRARIHTDPQLEIYADDVKCSHGATVGRTDENELFYMRSRGIAGKEAMILQQLAFAREVLDRIGNEELRERLAVLVERRLRGEFSDCDGCSRNCC